MLVIICTFIHRETSLSSFATKSLSTGLLFLIWYLCQKDLKPYQSARDDFSTESEVTFLDANENGLGSVGAVMAFNRYPDPYQSVRSDTVPAPLLVI